MNASYWFAFECFAHGGVLVDVSVREGQLGEPPAAKCPLCRELMHFRGKWEASPGGYGSRSTSDAALALDVLRDVRWTHSEDVREARRCVEDLLEQRWRATAEKR